MKHMRRLICMALMIATVLSLSVSAFAAEYTFESTSDSEYYPSTSYEDIYGSYNYGGINVVDYQIPELSYGCFSTTQTGVMEKVRLPGLQQYVNVSTSAGGYGVGAGSYGTPVISSGTQGRQHRHLEDPLSGHQHEGLGGRNQRQHGKGSRSLHHDLCMGWQRGSLRPQ